ncbi:hypothetical protein AB6809_29985 [Paraburkholderia sp. RCC_158]|uniref:hypothetical protein n=1 Tax=Paraburkholderia sp. RCC_158 TaxID=3239220 RepID=UPI00352453E0
MSIKKDITLDATGVVAGYHVVQQVSIDMLGKTTSVALMSYVSHDTYQAGKQPVQGAFSVFMKGVPADDQNAIAFVEETLIAAQPEEVDPAEAALPYAANRYVFAGGSIA